MKPRDESDEFLRELRERRQARDRRDLRIGFAFLLVAIVVSSVLWFVTR